MIYLTGASGFVGSNLAKLLLKRNIKFYAASRNWSDITTLNCSVVIHTAARVHIMKDTSSNPLQEFRVVNVDATLKLAKDAAKSGVKRFIFLSSIKVNGELTKENTFFSALDTCNPTDNYAISKMEAEQGLWRICQETGMQIVIIRPPLIYGAGVKANFKKMMQFIKNSVPLPLGAINNKRSLVALDNLLDLIITCIDHPAAANQTFLISDDEDISTTDLLRCMAKAMNKSAYLIPIPSKILLFGAKLLGKKDVAQRLLGNLQVDITHTKKVLGWTPPISVDEGLRRAVL